ncbi:hypothetical protein CALCODRAFT_369446 [Calocera cornea HHB12733]|uniref:Uncharacterized protein n=1 Tax=Calocera cornea HHB12733 TaxID=1353952 RepID=A0A165EJS2_9BASI|nr:hypothetical protein CALCODRAFT_369446 [Calocera cornea HHB12733]
MGEFLQEGSEGSLVSLLQLASVKKLHDEGGARVDLSKFSLDPTMCAGSRNCLYLCCVPVISQSHFYSLQRLRELPRHAGHRVRFTG